MVVGSMDEFRRAFNGKSMKEIGQAIKEIESGQYKTHKDVRKEMGF